MAFFGTGAVLVYYQRNARRRSRRAKRAGNGARKEVVVVAGPAAGAVTRSVAMDLERRGFVVYVVVHTVEEEAEVDMKGKDWGVTVVPVLTRAWRHLRLAQQ